MITFRYLVSKTGRHKSDVILENYTPEQLAGRIVTWNCKTFKYTVFDNSHQLYAYIMSADERDRVLQEVVFDRKQRIHFDIDKIPVEAFERVRKAIRYVWQNSPMLPSFDKRRTVRVIVMDSGGTATIPTPGIISRHIVINYYLPNHAIMKQFAQEVIERLKSEKNGDEIYVDMNYGTIHNFRLLYCRKYKNGWLGPPKLPITKGFAFADSLVQS